MYHFLAVPPILRLKILTLQIKISLQRTVVGSCSDTMGPVHQIVIFLFYEGMIAL